MIYNFNIEQQVSLPESGFGFEAFKFATEHNLAGSISIYTGGKCKICMEGSRENIATFISWWFINQCDNNKHETISISSGALRHYKEFIINTVIND